MLQKCDLKIRSTVNPIAILKRQYKDSKSHTNQKPTMLIHLESNPCTAGVCSNIVVIINLTIGRLNNGDT